MSELKQEIKYIRIDANGNQILGAMGAAYGYLPGPQLANRAQEAKERIKKIQTESRGTITPSIPDDPQSSLVKIDGLLEYISEEGSLHPLFFNPGSSYKVKVKKGDYVRLNGIPCKAEEDSEISLAVSKDQNVVEKILSGNCVRTPN